MVDELGDNISGGYKLPDGLKKQFERRYNGQTKEILLRKAKNLGDSAFDVILGDTFLGLYLGDDKMYESSEPFIVNLGGPATVIAYEQKNKKIKVIGSIFPENGIHDLVQ